jgi:hypothetical protein
MSVPPTTLESALAALPARHRRVVAEAIGASGEETHAIAAVLRDEAHLEALVGELPNEARAAITELAFAAAGRPQGEPSANGLHDARRGYE